MVSEPRVGTGYDVHPLVADRPLVLGGVRVPSDRGLAGHSDADVAVHALIDALLGAAGLGDIGEWFPSDDEPPPETDSRRLLATIRDAVAEKGWRVINVDLTIICQIPRVAPHRHAMRAALAGVLGVPEDRVNVKATTTDGLGAIGRGEGIACQAVVLLAPRKAA